MAPLSDRRLKCYIAASAAIAVVGLVLYLVGRGKYDSLEFWSIYRVSTGGVGLMMVIFGLIWLFLCLLNFLTKFFDISTRMEADKFVISMVLILVAVGGLLMLALPKLPQKGLDQLPQNSEQRAKVVRKERNFRVLVTGVVLCCGIAAASIPCRRFLMK